jgi:hypothetical protein
LAQKPFYEEDYQMRYPIILIIMVLTAALCSQVMADTLEMADGSLVEGRYVTSNDDYFIFEVGGDVEAFPVDEVAALYLSEGVEKMLEATEETAPAAVTIPEGTRLLIAMSDTVDSNRHRAGHRFRGQLQGDIVVDGNTIVKHNSYVFGTVTEGSQSRRIAGRSELQIEFVDMMVEGQLFPITTTGLKAESDQTALQSVGQTARGAAVGALIGGRSGARTGAAIGAGAAILTQGETVYIPRGTLVETTLSAPLIVQ